MYVHLKWLLFVPPFLVPVKQEPFAPLCLLSFDLPPRRLFVPLAQNPFLFFPSISILKRNDHIFKDWNGIVAPKDMLAAGELDPSLRHPGSQEGFACPASALAGSEIRCSLRSR